MKSKQLASILLAGLLTVGGTSCSSQSGSANSGSNTQGSGETPSGEVVEIRYSEWDGGDTLAVYEQIAENFNKEHPNIKVTVMNIPDEYPTKITAMAAANDLPEVMNLDAGNVLFPFAEEGYLMNLQELIDADPDFDETQLMEQFKGYDNDGNFIAYAVGSENQCMFYNPKIFEENNIEMPPADYADAWDWDEFVEVCQKLTFDKNGNNALSPDFDPENIDSYGISLSRWWLGYMPFMYSVGANYLNEDGTEIGIASPEGIQVLQNLSDLMHVYHVAPTPTASETMPGASEALATGKIAMVFDGQWNNATFMADELEYDVAALPKMGDIAKTSMSYGTLAVANGEHSAEGWEFLKYMLSEGSCMPLFESGLWLPTNAHEYNEDFINSFITDKHPEHYYEACVKPMLDGTAEKSIAMSVVNFTQIEDIINPALDEVWSGEKTAEEALSAIVDNANAQCGGWRK